MKTVLAALRNEKARRSGGSVRRALSSCSPRGCKARYAPLGSHRPVRGTLTAPREAHNGPVGPSFERAGMRFFSLKTVARTPALRTLFTPSMTKIESFPLALHGLALAWESVAVVVGALAVGLLLGALAKAWRRGPVPPDQRERDRELESLRRISAELSRTSDVESVARALLDEIASLFSVGF